MTTFPTSLDSLTNPGSGDDLDTAGVVHHTQHSDANDAIEALEAKVGANGSAVTSSLDYKVANHGHTGADGSADLSNVIGGFAPLDSGLLIPTSYLPAITEAMQTLADNTTRDVSITKHGYAPKAPNDVTKFLNGTGAYTVPPAGNGPGGAAFDQADSPGDLEVVSYDAGTSKWVSTPLSTLLAATGAAFTWRAAWSGATAYAVGDAVSSGGSSYFCILGHTNHTPPNATYWAVLASKGDTGATGAQGATGAAGASGADRFVFAAPTGALAETFSRLGATMVATAVMPLTGVLYLVACPLLVGTPVTSITFRIGSTAAVTPTHSWVALFDSALALKSQSADATNAAIGSQSNYTGTLGAPQTIAASGLFYLGFLVTAGTMPTLGGVTTPAGPQGVAAIIAGSSTSGLTTTAPNPAAAITATSAVGWAWVS